MRKQTLAAVILCAGAAIGLTAPAEAGSLYATASTAEYQSPDGYDFSSLGNDPPTTYQNIGTFTFTPILDTELGSITISGTFGNEDYGLTTALSDYYLGDATDGEQAVEVAACDSILGDCYSAQEGPTNWSLTLDSAQISDLANGLAAGSIDFGYTWDQGTPPIPDGTFFADPNGYDLQYVNAGPATLDVYSPEPATVLFCFSGIAGIFVLRRFRKV